MINYDSILSAFDGKPTLLQWLKLVKKALDESVLKDITLKQDGANVVFTFNFEDGTSLSTPAVTLPKGDTGANGDKGDKGEQGVSVTGVDEVSNEVVGSQTLTTLRFNFSNGTNNEVVVHAENGKSGGKLYLHDIVIEKKSNPGEGIFKCKIISTQSTKFNSEDFTDEVIKNMIQIVIGNGTPPLYYEVREIIAISNGIGVEYYISYPYDVQTTNNIAFTAGDSNFTDTVTEL